jgi:hypothetical protein
MAGKYTVCPGSVSSLSLSLLEKNVKPHERLFIPNYHFYRTDRFPGRKGGTAVAVTKGILHNNIDLPLLSV